MLGFDRAAVMEALLREEENEATVTYALMVQQAQDARGGTQVSSLGSVPLFACVVLVLCPLNTTIVTHQVRWSNCPFAP